MVGVERFRHVGIIVRDLDLMVAFYTRTMGLTLKRTFEVESEAFAKGVGIPGARAKGAHLMMGETKLELLQFLNNLDGSPKAATNVPGYRHVAFVVSDHDADYRKLRDAGDIEVFFRTCNYDDATEHSRISLCLLQRS